MSYVAAVSLQKAVYSALAADVELQGLTGGHVFDAPPSGNVPDLYVQLGAESVKARVDASGAVSRHDLTISIVRNADAFLQAKEAAARVSAVLHGLTLELERGDLTSLDFLKARAQRVRGAGGRRVDLIFRAVVDAA